MSRTCIVLLLAGAMVSAMARPARAHHAYAAFYFQDRTESLEGNLVEFEFRNPHSIVHIEVSDPKGQVQRWAIEWFSGQRLSQQGVTSQTLKPGDRLLVTGSPGRNVDDHRMLMRTITRPKDGWKWSAAAPQR